MNNTRELTPNKFVQTLTMIYMMLLSGLLFFGALMFFQFKGDFTPSFDTSDTLLLIYPVIVIGAVLLSQFLSKKLLAEADKKPDLKSKLQSYQTATIIRLAILEGPAFFGLVMGLSSGNTTYVAIAGVLVFFMILNKPSRSKIESELNLRGEHRNQFNRYDEVID